MSGSWSSRTSSGIAREASGPIMLSARTAAARTPASVSESASTSACTDPAASAPISPREPAAAALSCRVGSRSTSISCGTKGSASRPALPSSFIAHERNLKFLLSSKVIVPSSRSGRCRLTLFRAFTSALTLCACTRERVRLAKSFQFPGAATASSRTWRAASWPASMATRANADSIRTLLSASWTLLRSA